MPSLASCHHEQHLVHEFNCPELHTDLFSGYVRHFGRDYDLYGPGWISPALVLLNCVFLAFSCTYYYWCCRMMLTWELFGCDGDMSASYFFSGSAASSGFFPVMTKSINWPTDFSGRSPTNMLTGFPSLNPITVGSELTCCYKGKRKLKEEFVRGQGEKKWPGRQRQSQGCGRNRPWPASHPSGLQLGR